MSTVIKRGNIRFKDSNTGEYIGVDVVAEKTTAEMVSDIETAGESQVSQIESTGAAQIQSIQTKGIETYNSIPSDYSTLSDDVTDLKSALNAISASTQNIVELEDVDHPNQGVIYHPDPYNNTVQITGTATGSGDAGSFFIDQTLPAGTYSIEFFDTTQEIRWMIRNVSDSSVIAGPFTENVKTFTLSGETRIKVGVQVINGTTYNQTVRVQIVEGSPLGYFVPSTSANDFIARGRIDGIDSELTEIGNEIGTVQTALDDKLPSDYYFGVGDLPVNYNYGENTTTPRLLYPRENDSHHPGVRIVSDTDSPVSKLFGYKRQIFKGTQTGWQSIFDNTPNLYKSDTESLTIGFWVNDEEAKTVFTTTSKNLTFLFLANSTHRFRVGVPLLQLINNVGVEINGTLIENTATFDSVTIKAECEKKTLRYDYIRITLKKMDFVDGYDFANLCPSLFLYWQFDDVSSEFSNKQITMAGLTILRNTEEINPDYRYPDEDGLEQIPQSGILSETSEDSDSQKLITVTYNEGAEEDLKIISTVDGVIIENTIMALTDDNTYNNTVRPLACYLTINGTKYKVFNSEDDGCPVSLSSGYIAGGHGYNRAKRLTAQNHGKTYADITSEWLDTNDKKWYIVRIEDENTLVVLGESEGTNDYDTISTLTGNLTHSQGAVHTDAIAYSAQTTIQLEPLSMNNEKKVLLDGQTQITESGRYTCEFVDIINEYDVANPAGIVPALIANKPSGGYTSNPDVNVGTGFMHISNIYRFLKDGTLILYSTLDNQVPITFGYWGATQYAEKTTRTIFGGTRKKYIPDVLPVTVSGTEYDMREFHDTNGWSASLNYGSQYWQDADYPPDRIVTLFTDGNNKYKAGFTVGYLPIGAGASATRKNAVSNALNLYSSLKYYPHLIDSQTIASNTPIQTVSYRKPVIKVDDTYTDMYYVPFGDKCYLYVDYHSTGENRIKVPAEYVGKPMTVIHQTVGITVYGTIAMNEIRIKCTSVSPNACVVIQIG